MLGGFAERFRLSREDAARLACAFGGGIAGSGQTCGAVTGALMAIGLAQGASTAGDQAAKAKTYALTRTFWSRFEERHGSLVCRDLLGVDIGTPEGRDAAVQAGLFRTRCPLYVREAAEIVDRLL